jgi:hypothetical protein
VLPVIEGVAKLEPELGDHEFLGHGKITVSDMKIDTPRSTPCPTAHGLHRSPHDLWRKRRRRHRAGARPRFRIPQEKGEITIEMMTLLCRAKLHRLCLPGGQVLPGLGAGRRAHPLVQAGLEASAPDRDARIPGGKWNFSTNGIYWGQGGHPQIGFGPGEEETAHTDEG